MLDFGVRNADALFFLQLHDEFDDVERIGAEVAGQGRVERDLVGGREAGEPADKPLEQGAAVGTKRGARRIDQLE
jgi:hypothetical protein